MADRRAHPGPEGGGVMSERVFERANQGYGAAGSLVHQVRAMNDPLRRSMVHQ